METLIVKGMMMKHILFIIIVIINCSSCTISSQDNTSQAISKIKFSIEFSYRYDPKKISVSNEMMNYPQLRVLFDKGQFTFYDYKVVITNKQGIPLEVYSEEPLIDENKKQIEINPKDSIFLSKLESLFLMQGYVDSNKKKVLLCPLIGINDKTKGLETIEGERKRKGSSSNSIFSGVISYDTIKKAGYDKLPEGSILYLDSDYNFIVWKFENGEYKLNKFEALNPGLINESTQPGFEQIAPPPVYLKPVNKEVVEKKGYGYIWLKESEDYAYVAGDKFILKAPMEIREDVLFVPCKFILDNLNGTYLQNQTKNEVTITRHFQIISYIEPRGYRGDEAEIILTIGEKEAIVNGEIISLSVAPYENNGEVMVPIEEFCRYLGAEYHYRPIDNSILIARYPKSE